MGLEPLMDRYDGHQTTVREKHVEILGRDVMGQCSIRTAE